MPLSQILFFEEQAAGIGKRYMMEFVTATVSNNVITTNYTNTVCFLWNLSAKIVIHLHPALANKEPGPYQHSKYPYIKLSFKEHGQIEVVLVLLVELKFNLTMLL